MILPVKFNELSKHIDVKLSDAVLIYETLKGATFYPLVSEDGIISWTNDQDLENPQPVNIKGEEGFSPIVSIKEIQNGYKITITNKNNIVSFDIFNGEQGLPGYTPIKGVDYFDGINGKDGRDGKDGYTPVKGKDYFDGAPGKDGAQGPKGDKGDKGDRGEQGIQGPKGDQGEPGEKGKDGANGSNGKDGYTPIKGVDYFDGKDGVNGKDGANGYTPVKGTDYFTEADKVEMVSSVISALPKYEGEVVEI